LIPRGKALQVKLAGVDSLDLADRLAGMDVFVSAEILRPAEEGNFFIFQLIGCQVLTLEGEKIGPVVDVFSAGESHSLVVERKGKEVLIPFHESICTGVDLARKEIRISPPAGLLDLNEI
jgi:16S rRNA processing protein RimM